MVALIGLFVGAALAQITRDYLIPSTGVIASTSLDITWASDGAEVTVIDWGPTENGVTYTMEEIEITNTGTVPVTLSLSTQNEVGITALTLSWDYMNEVINPSGSVTVILEQTITATDSYAYDTIITATET